NWHSALKRGVVVSPLFPPPIFKIQEQKPQKKTAENLKIKFLKINNKLLLYSNCFLVGTNRALCVVELVLSWE
ncbi:TPA: hypothetical protein ACSCWO_002799, partial [Staphylococcus aureus]